MVLNVPIVINTLDTFVVKFMGRSIGKSVIDEFKAFRPPYI